MARSSSAGLPVARIGLMATGWPTIASIYSPPSAGAMVVVLAITPAPAKKPERIKVVRVIKKTLFSRGLNERKIFCKSLNIICGYSR